MKKVLSIIMLCVFALAFVGGIATSNVEAKPKCSLTCINGVEWICCPVGQSGLRCYWGDPC